MREEEEGEEGEYDAWKETTANEGMKGVHPGIRGRVRRGKRRKRNENTRSGKERKKTLEIGKTVRRKCEEKMRTRFTYSKKDEKT